MLKPVRACFPAPLFLTGQERNIQHLSGSVADGARNVKSGEMPILRFTPIFQPSSRNPSILQSNYHLPLEELPGLADIGGRDFIKATGICRLNQPAEKVVQISTIGA